VDVLAQVLPGSQPFARIVISGEPAHPMKPLALLLAAILYLCTYLPAQTPVATIPLAEIHPGMRGVAYTVFQGRQPEAMEVEVLGVMHNVNGPKSDVILVRLHGPKVEYTGVVAGMSGSPVYFDGKLAGALAFRIGEFSKEPIAGVTPIGEMLEINALDRTPAQDAPASSAGTAATATRAATPETGSANNSGFANVLTPIETPLVFTGFSEAAVRQFAPQFAGAGIVPVMGAGSFSGSKQPEPLVAGTTVSAVLVRGDMDISAACTVTYADAERLLACGHPLMQFGSVDLPMNKAEVLVTVASPANAFKIVNTTETAGSFVQDRHAGILGVFGKDAHMIPVTLNVHSATAEKQFHYEVLNNPRISPIALMVTVFNALHGLNEYGEEITYRMRGRIDVDGYPQVNLKNVFSPTESGQPGALQAALGIGDRFGRIFENPYSVPQIRAVNLDFDLVRERRWAVLESARSELTEVRPGDDLTIEAVLRPYRGERILRRIPVHIPASAAKGTFRVLVSDGDTLDRLRRGPAAFSRRLDLASTIALLNREHSNNRLYVSLLQADPEAIIGDKVLPAVPLSVMNVLDGMRNTQEMVVLGESAVNEAFSEFDSVITGAQILTINIK
jgi:hypothetical protein